MEKTLTKEQAKDKALRLLEFRSHSEKELSDKLKRAGAREEDLPFVIGFLKEYGFINDLKYACAKARELSSLKKFGKHRIAADLKFRGIAPEYIDEALSLLDDNEEEKLLPMLQKKLGGNFERKNIDKAMRHFAAKGYSFDCIKQCIDKLENENLQKG